MRDKVARAALQLLAAKIGCKVYSSRPNNRGDLSIEPLGFYDKLELLEREIKELKENARPVCKTCGQKIQEGFREGDIEKVSAAVASGKRTKR